MLFSSLFFLLLTSWLITWLMLLICRSNCYLWSSECLIYALSNSSFFYFSFSASAVRSLSCSISESSSSRRFISLLSHFIIFFRFCSRQFKLVRYYSFLVLFSEHSFRIILSRYFCSRLLQNSVIVRSFFSLKSDKGRVRFPTTASSLLPFACVSLIFSQR